MQLLPAFPSYISVAHKMLLANKQAHRQNKLSRHVRAIGEAGRGEYKTSSVNKHSEAKKKKKKGQLLAGQFDMEVLHVIHLHC